MSGVCAVVPVFDHQRAVSGVVAALRGHGLAVVLVDDGSAPACAAVLDGLCDEVPPPVTLLRHGVNRGKGAAVVTGLRHAAGAGFSHALQIDADGQHELADVPALLAASRADPEAVIAGAARYDDSVPRARRYGRYATHVWVWVNTLSLRIRDAMCGFRVYPLAPMLELLDREAVGSHMDFDVEILVRLHWRGVMVVSLPTRVRYPPDGISHFQPFRDNLRLAALHARLFFGMLQRLPVLLRRRRQGA